MKMGFSFFPLFPFQMRLIMEILWPLILFLILVAVRTRGLRKFNHQCEYSSLSSYFVFPLSSSFIQESSFQVTKQNNLSSVDS